MLDERIHPRNGQGACLALRQAGPKRFASHDGETAIRFGPDLDNDRILLEHDRGTLPRQDTIRLAAKVRPGRGAADGGGLEEKT